MVIVDCPGGAYIALVGDVAKLDAAVVVVEPYPRSGEVARRLLDRIAESSRTPKVFVVANKIGYDADLEAVRGFLPDVEIDLVVPLDPDLMAADAEGIAPIDAAHDGAGVVAISNLAGMLG